MKRLLLLLLNVCIAYFANAQLNSLTIDCQNPGWLDKLIDGPTQVSVQSIKVTGKINSNDILFLQTLPNLIRVDLEDVLISKEGMSYGYNDNEWRVQYMVNWTNKLQALILPKFILKEFYNAQESYRINKMDVDSLFVGSTTWHKVIFYKPTSGLTENWGALGNIDHLIVNEGVDTLSCEIGNTANVKLPESIKVINLHFMNSDYVKNINLPNSIEVIDGLTAWYPSLPSCLFEQDTIFYPSNLKRLLFGKIDKSIKCKHAFISENIEGISGKYASGHGLNNETQYDSGLVHAEVLHVAKNTPPNYGYNYYKELTGQVVYVPKGYISNYQNDTFFQYATLLEEPVHVKAVGINSHSEKIKKGNTRTLYATITPSDADNPNYFWYSEDENIATISDTGKVTAVKSGKTKIYAISEENPAIKDCCEIEVYQPLSSISISATTNQVNVGESIALSIVPNPTDADNASVNWFSSDTNIATINDAGVVCGKKAGKTTITAKSKENSNIESNIEITVLQPVTGVSINPSEIDLTLGKSQKLSAVVEPEDASNKKVTWSSSDASTCFVANDGTIVGVKLGIAFVFATTEDGGYVGNCRVTVVEEGGVDQVKADETTVTTSDGEIIVSSTENILITIYDYVGKQVYNGYLKRIGGLSKGVYFVVIGNKVYKVSL